MTSSGGVGHQLDCQTLPTERLHSIKATTYLKVLLHISQLFWATHRILVRWVPKCIVRCAVGDRGSGAVCVCQPVCHRLRYVTPMSRVIATATQIGMYVVQAVKRAVRFTAILLWNYYCDHFVFVATIREAQPLTMWTKLQGGVRSLGFLRPYAGKYKTFEEMGFKTLKWKA